MTLKEAYLGAIEREIVLRRGYLPRQEMNTLYFGGGTPSYLKRGELERIIRKLEENYSFARYGANHRVESRRSGAGKIAGNKGFGV